MKSGGMLVPGTQCTVPIAAGAVDKLGPADNIYRTVTATDTDYALEAAPFTVPDTTMYFRSP